MDPVRQDIDKKAFRPQRQSKGKRKKTQMFTPKQKPTKHEEAELKTIPQDLDVEDGDYQFDMHDFYDDDFYITESPASK